MKKNNENERNNKVLIIISIVVLVLVAFLALRLREKPTKTPVETDSEKFAREYGWVDEFGNKIDNVFVYRTPEEIIKILKNGTGIVYLGFPECPWCGQYVVYLNEVAKKNNVKKINYLNILEDRKNNTDAYKEITSILSDYLQYDDDGNKRIYVPAVIAVKDGKIVGFDDETSYDTKGYENPQDYWENEDLAGLKDKLSCMMKDCEKSICTSDCNK